MPRNTITNIVAVSLLTFVGLVSFFSVKDDSLTMDELAHLPAGYSYLTQKDMRLNPEHPPLIKDLAAIPLLFIKDINFPSDINSWKEDINGQWDFGREFLYNSGNPADKIIFAGRIPMILLLVFLGFFIFKWAKELFGNKASLLALFFFSFSPAFLAHGRLVTTDVGAALGITLATYYFLKSLQFPALKNIIIAGLTFGLALLLKFSTILLIPFFGILLVVWIVKKRRFTFFVLRFALIMAIGLLLIWPVYLYHIWNYPAEKQISDTQNYIQNTADILKQPIIFMAENPVLRPYAQYFAGLSMIFQRVAGGNTTYFMGEINNQAWKEYFPIVYAIKEPLAFFISGLFALFYGLRRIRKITFPIFTFLLFIAIYWLVSIKGNLNIGVRHLLPVFPFTIILVSATAANLLKNPYLKIKYALFGGLIVWQIISVISVYPSFLAYFNELAGGPNGGKNYVVDSNLDWGQDLKRLARWVEENKIENIYIDYFGGGGLNYYFKNKYSPWWGQKNTEELPNGSYLAVSASFLQGGGDFYNWLKNYQPVAIIGHSIFVYYIN